VPVAFAAWGAAWAIQARQRASGIAFAAAILTKVWPVVIVPALWLRDRRAFWWAVATAALGGVVWVVVGGVEGVRQVVGFRGATGWEVESVIGSIVWVVRDAPVRLEGGAPRVGTMAPGANVALAVLLVSLEALIWTRASKSRRDAFGGASVAAVGALLMCAPVFSLQYAAWLLPWAAVADADGDRGIVRLVAAIEVLTGALFVLYSPERLAISKVAVVIRNALVLAVVFVWLRSTTTAPPSSSETHPATA
jgi:hypothetical protein